MSPRKKPFRRPEYKQKKKKKNEYRNRYKSDDYGSKKVPLTVLTSVAAAVLLIITGIGIWAGVHKGNNVVPTAVSSVVSVTENGEVNVGETSEQGENPQEQIKELSPLEVHFIDVGQGDSVLLTCGGESMLIDGGDEYKGTTVQLYLSKHNISKLKYVIASHPDSDHIGGLDVIVTKYDIESEAVFIPDIYRDTKAYEELAEAVKYRNYRMMQPECGQEYLLGDSTVTIVYESSEILDDNDRSLVVKVTHGNAGFLFTGDISSVSEETLAGKYDLSADVLKVSHHGSAYSTTGAFVKAVGPSYAIFSVGENVYGHPDYEVAKRLNSYGSKLYRTDSQGSIVVVSDGKDITVNAVPCDISAFEPAVEETPPEATYILNINTNKFHYPGCDSVDRMKEKNKKPVTWTREECIARGYVPCGYCHP